MDCSLFRVIMEREIMIKKATVGLIVLGIAVGNIFAESYNYDEFGAYQGREGVGQLRGTTHFSMAVSQWHWSDEMLDDVFGESYGFSAGVNYNAVKNVDIVVGYSGFWDSAQGDDFNGNSISVGFNYIFAPESKFSPYVGGAVGWASSSISDYSDDFLTLGAQVGAEWSLIDLFLIDASLIYAYADTTNVGADDLGLHVTAGVFVTEKVVLSVGGAYMLDAEDSVLQLGVTFK